MCKYSMPRIICCEIRTLHGHPKVTLQTARHYFLSMVTKCFWCSIVIRRHYDSICELIETEWHICPQTSNINAPSWAASTVDHSDVGAASTTLSFSTQSLALIDGTKTTARRDEEHLSLGIWCGLYHGFHDKRWGLGQHWFRKWLIVPLYYFTYRGKLQSL